jgi:hypothetical protein
VENGRRRWIGVLAAIMLASATGWTLRGAEAPVTWKHFRGICDASTLEMLNDDLFLVADDEDNLLRLYSRAREGFPVATYDLSRSLGLLKRTREIDFEGSARIGDHLFFISSHGANKKGKPQPSRHRIMAVRVSGDGTQHVQLTGYYPHLLRDLAGTPALAAYHFREAAARPPKSENALNIEGLAATFEGHLLVGFRNPIPGGSALILPILNPLDLIRGKPAKFGEPVHLSLNGMGIRSLTAYREGYLVVAGPYAGDEASLLFHWDGKSSEARLLTPGTALPANPEGVAVVSAGGREVLFALSDDGTRSIGGRDCKKLKDSSRKMFRAYEIPLALE